MIVNVAEGSVAVLRAPLDDGTGNSQPGPTRGMRVPRLAWEAEVTVRRPLPEGGADDAAVIGGMRFCRYGGFRGRTARIGL